MKRLRFRYTWRESWCNCVWKTLYLIFTLLAMVNIHLRSFPQHGLSRDHVVRLPRTTGGTPPPNRLHSQSQGRCWYFRTALETLSTQIGGECSSLPREKRLFDLLGVRIWQWIYVECILTTRDLTSWSQPYRDDKCTKQLYSVWILPVNYKRIMNRHARRIDPRVDKLASETHGPSCSDYRVAWDFDSPWITGPMTAHQSVAHVRHIK